MPDDREHPCPNNPLAIGLCDNDRSREIRQLCNRAGMPEAADGFIDCGMTVAEVKETLFDALAGKNGGDVNLDLAASGC